METSNIRSREYSKIKNSISDLELNQCTKCLKTKKDMSQWDKLVKGSQEGKFFHGTAWIKFLEKYGASTDLFHPRHICVSSGDNLIAALPLFIEGNSRGESLPYGDYGGPVISQNDDRDHILQFLLSTLLDLDLRYIRLKGVPNPYFRALREKGFEVNPGLSTFILDLEDMDEKSLYSRLRRDAKRGIKKAQKGGLSILESEGGRDQIDDYHRLHLITAKRISAPERHRDFFQFLWDVILKKNLGRLTLAYDGNRVVAGLICMINHARPGTLHIYSNVSSPEAGILHANDLLYWDAIKWSVSNGLGSVDMGLSPLDPKSSLCVYKKKWGAERELIYFATRMSGYTRLRMLASTAAKKVKPIHN